MKLYTLDVTCLENARRGLQQPFSPLQLALGRLVSEADKLRGQPPESVVHKKLRPVSGDPHDYYSLGLTGGPIHAGRMACRISAATGTPTRNARTMTLTPRALFACVNVA